VARRILIKLLSLCACLLGAAQVVGCQLEGLPPRGATWTSLAVDQLMRLFGPPNIELRCTRGAPLSVKTISTEINEQDPTYTGMSTTVDASANDHVSISKRLIGDRSIWNWCVILYSCLHAFILVDLLYSNSVFDLICLIV